MRDCFHHLAGNIAIFYLRVSVHEAVTLLIALSVIHMNALRQLDESRKISVVHAHLQSNLVY